jgi:hypothetical protein
MRAKVYEALAERVGDGLDYDVRWQPNEYEPDGFVERVRSLQLTNGILLTSSCPQCGVSSSPIMPRLPARAAGYSLS